MRHTLLTLMACVVVLGGCAQLTQLKDKVVAGTQNVFASAKDINLPKFQILTPVPKKIETPAEVAARVKSKIRVVEVIAVSQNAINVTMRYDGKEALKYLKLVAHYDALDIPYIVQGPIAPGDEFPVRFRDAVLNTYETDFSRFSWSVASAAEDVTYNSRFNTR